MNSVPRVIYSSLRVKIHLARTIACESVSRLPDNRYVPVSNSKAFKGVYIGYLFQLGLVWFYTVFTVQILSCVHERFLPTC
jgi:hypothetical protein